MIMFAQLVVFPGPAMHAPGISRALHFDIAGKTGGQVVHAL